MRGEGGQPRASALKAQESPSGCGLAFANLHNSARLSTPHGKPCSNQDAVLTRSSVPSFLLRGGTQLVDPAAALCFQISFSLALFSVSSHISSLGYQRGPRRLGQAKLARWAEDTTWSLLRILCSRLTPRWFLSLTLQIPLREDEPALW